jgi:Family of unknown function (DUF5670)
MRVFRRVAVYPDVWLLRNIVALLNCRTTDSKGVEMLWTISIILFSLWLLGVATPFTLHGYIHVLLLVAGLVTLLPLMRKKRPVD